VTVFIKAKGTVVLNSIGMKFGRIVPPVTIHQLMESNFRSDSHFYDDSHNVTSRRKCAATY